MNKSKGKGQDSLDSDDKVERQDSLATGSDETASRSSAAKKAVVSSDATAGGGSRSTKPRVAELTPNELAKRREENRRHAAASRARNRDTYEKLVIQLSDLQQEVREERGMNSLLRERLFQSWQTQTTLFQAIGMGPFPLPSSLEAPVPAPSAASAQTGQFPPVDRSAQSGGNDSRQGW